MAWPVCDGLLSRESLRQQANQGIFVVYTRVSMNWQTRDLGCVARLPSVHLYAQW